MLVDHDIHIHTTLSSCCADEQATPENIIARAAEEGLKTIGFADHMWDSRMPGASDWYMPQDLEHILKIRDMIPKDTKGVKVLVGCETEYCGNGKVGISREAAEQLDFVLIPASHVHMKGFVLPSWAETPKDIARVMLQHFNEVVGLGLATGITHPFLPVNHGDHVDEIISYILDSEFEEAFHRAAEARVSIEITTGCFPGISGRVREGFHDETFMRVLTIAKNCGCKFHFASDAHSLAGIGRVLQLEKYVKEIGITPDDILQL